MSNLKIKLSAVRDYVENSYGDVGGRRDAEKDLEFIELKMDRLLELTVKILDFIEPYNDTQDKIVADATALVEEMTGNKIS